MFNKKEIYNCFEIDWDKVDTFEKLKMLVKLRYQNIKPNKHYDFICHEDQNLPEEASEFVNYKGKIKY